MRSLGVTETVYESYVAGKDDYAPEVAALQAAGVGVLLIGGYHTEVALLARAARDRSYPVEIMTGVTLATEEFGLLAGPAAEGVLFIDPPDPRKRAEAAAVMERMRAANYQPESYTLYAYAAVQVWAKAVEASGSFELQPVIATLRKGRSRPCLDSWNSTTRATSRSKTQSSTSGTAGNTSRWTPE